MIRLIGVDLPTKKRIAYSLTAIHGIGLQSAKKLVELVERARNNSSEQGPLIPLEALVTVENDEWI